jgi:hypothetical protein
MTPMPTTEKHTIRAIGELCVGGDWACAHGDLGGLRHVAQQLADYVPEPMHCALIELATTCGCDPDRACALWARLKTDLYRSERLEVPAARDPRNRCGQ